MRIKTIKNNKGFTLVETMFAVMILTFTIVSMMTVVANSLFSARYARNEITANYLMQEVIDSVRNDRDTTAFLQSGSDPDTAWINFLGHYNHCFTIGCHFDTLSTDMLRGDRPVPCPSEGCSYLYYDPNINDTSYYTYDDPDHKNIGVDGITPKINSGFKRTVIVVPTPGKDEVEVVVTVKWENGSIPVSRSLSTTLLKWQ